MRILSAPHLPRRADVGMAARTLKSIGYVIPTIPTTPDLNVGKNDSYERIARASFCVQRNRRNWPGGCDRHDIACISGGLREHAATPEPPLKPGNGPMYADVQARAGVDHHQHREGLRMSRRPQEE